MERLRERLIRRIKKTRPATVVLALGILAGGYAGTQAAVGGYSVVNDERKIDELQRETSLLRDTNLIISWAAQDLSDYEGHPQVALSKIQQEIDNSESPQALGQKLDTVRAEIGDITKTEQVRIQDLGKIKDETNTSIDVMTTEAKAIANHQADESLRFFYGIAGTTGALALNVIYVSIRNHRRRVPAA